MEIKNTLKAACGAWAALALASCGGPSIEGAWVEPVPGMETQTQGVLIEAGGKASSINMATLKYEAWQKDGNRLLLSGQSIGNGQTIPFTDTLEIQALTADSLVLKQANGYVHTYQKQR